MPSWRYRFHSWPVPRKGETMKDDFTPIPTNDFNKLTQTIASIDSTVKSIHRDLLPPLFTDTKEARDTAREALGKINGHEANERIHEHECTERDRQLRQDNELDELNVLSPRVAFLSKLTWALVGVLISGVGSAVGFALASRSVGASNTARIESQQQVDTRHDELLRNIQQLRESDRREFIQLSNDLPRRIMEAQPTARQVQEAVENLPLTPVEERRVRGILDQARKRQGDRGHGNE